MNKEILYEALFSPSRVGEVPREELERVAREYPYFNSAQVLLARSYRQTGDHRFSDQLQVASQTSGDRLSLYHLLKENPPSVEAKILEKGRVIEQDKAEIISTPPELKEEIDSKTEETVFVAPMVVRPLPVSDIAPVDIEKPEKEEVILSPEKISEPEKKAIAVLPVPEPITNKEANKPVRDALEDAILARAVSSSIEIEVGEEYEQSENEEENEDENLPIEENHGENLSETEDSTDTFAAWVAQRAKDIGYQGDNSKTNRLPTYNEAGQLRIQPSENKKKTQQDLIDRFIQTNPRIQPGKSDEYDLENVARASITEDLSVVSETMAVLLASQGKKEKARRVYRKLMELHPEKSVYFAAQLKILDKLK